eukprot:scaffold6.g2914.t1
MAVGEHANVSNGDNGAGEGYYSRQLVGCTNFVRHNPRSDRFPMHKFHHIEFWCGDATNTAARFGFGLGMTLVGKSDQGTGNQHCASYTGDIVFAFTAPYSCQTDKTNSTPPLPWYDQDEAHTFLRKHGLAVRAMGVLVEDAAEAYRISVEHGAVGVTPPETLLDEATGTSAVVSEVVLYKGGDCLLRFVSGSYEGPYLPGYRPTPEALQVTYDLQRVDHAVGNVHNLIEQIEYLVGATGLHEFAEFTADDVGTVDSGLNSMVLANNNEMVLMPINEPTFGTKRKSQIQTFLEQNEGPGLQHIALKTDDIFATMRAMRARSALGGFEFMPRPSGEAGGWTAVEELGLLVDRDDQGILIQVFTRPLGDRPTVFVEIIERVCTVPAAAEPVVPTRGRLAIPKEIGGCGGFGKGNFSELFKSIEVYETQLGINETQ